jgi:hypothetical protein
MKPISAIVCMLIAVLVISGCNASKKAYNRGDYDRAVQLSVDKLRSKPNNKRATEILQKAWPRAVNMHQERIAVFGASNDRFKWEKIVSSYEQLNNMNESVRRCPACDKLVDTGNLYIDELTEARQNAAEIRYSAGVASLDPLNRQRSREAFDHFMVVERMVPDYRDTRERMNEALSYATLNVVVSVPPLQSRSLAVSHEFFHNKVMEFLNSNRRMNDFVRFYYPHEAKADALENPDHDVWLQFDDFVVGQTYLESHTETLISKDSVKVGEVTLDDGTKVDVLNRVEARFTRYRKTLVSGGVLDMQIIDSWNENVILQEKIPGEFVWVNEWATFNGDERALTAAQRQLTRQREAAPPPPQDLFVAFTGPIYDKVTDRLRRFYASY